MAALGSLGIALAPSAQAAQTPCDAEAKACLQLHTNRAWLMTNGSVSHGPFFQTLRPGDVVEVKS